MIQSDYSPLTVRFGSVAHPIIRTKINLPPARKKVVERPHLIERLDDALDSGARLFLFSAPAGFGKSPLAADWAYRLKDTARWHPLWISLDQTDDQPNRFFATLLAALQQYDPDSGSHLHEYLNLPRPLQPEEVAAGLVDDFAETGSQIILFLDDYHLLSDKTIQAVFNLLLDHQPQNLRLVVLTRQDPPFPLARMRSRSELLELRAADLRFTLAESTQFLKRLMGLDFREEDVAALEARTEGWAAGLQMAALSMQGRSDLPAFIAAFSGSHHYILDYLLEEVLNRLPFEIQQFLLYSAVLDRLCAPLCDAVMGFTPESGQPLSDAHSAPSARVILDYLENANLFLQPLDDERRWYRYHRLLTDLLRARLADASPALLPVLHERASDWYARQGMSTEAVEHAFSAGAVEKAAKLIDLNAAHTWGHANPQFFQQITRLPLEVIRRYPELSLHAAWMFTISGRDEHVEELIQAIEAYSTQQFGDLPLEELPERDRARLAFARALRYYRSVYSGDSASPEAAVFLAQAHAFVPEGLVGMRNTVEVMLGIIYTQESRFKQAEQLLQAAARRDVETGSTVAIPIAISRLARIRILQGRLDEAAVLCQHYQKYIDERGAWRYYINGTLKLVLGEVFYEWDRLDEALLLLRAGLQENLAWGIPHSILLAHALMARVQHARGDLQAARAAIEQGEQILQRARVHFDYYLEFERQRVLLWLAQGRLDEAQNWADRRVGEDLLDKDPGDTFNEQRKLTLLQVWTAAGQEKQAAVLLPQLAEAARQGGRFGRLAEIRALQAVCQGSSDSQALEFLAEALELAYQGGRIRLFRDLHPRLPVLLAQGVSRGILKDARLAAWAQRLVVSAESAPHRSQPGLVEPLSPRELEVLELVAAGLTNQQIAAQLVISIGTVKTHTSNIYQKLGVDNRTSALARARQLKIIQ